METTASTKAHRFFEETLPARVAAQLEKHLSTEGSISFKIGEESWTFRFGEAESIQEGADEAAGLQMSFDPAAFDAFLAGNLDMQLAVNAGTIRATGDFELLKRFGLFLESFGPSGTDKNNPPPFIWNFS